MADTTGGGLQYPKKPAARKGRKEGQARQQSSAMLRPESAIHSPQTVGVWLTHLIQPSQSSTAPTSRIPHGRLWGAVLDHFTDRHWFHQAGRVVIQYHRVLVSLGFCYVCFRREGLDSQGACFVVAVQHMHVLHRAPEAEVLLLGESLELIQRYIVDEHPLLSRKSLG